MCRAAHQLSPEERSKERKTKRGGDLNPLESRKGFRYNIRRAEGRPSNVEIRGLLGNEPLQRPSCNFWGAQVGTIKEGVALDER